MEAEEEEEEEEEEKEKEEKYPDETISSLSNNKKEKKKKKKEDNISKHETVDDSPPLELHTDAHSPERKPRLSTSPVHGISPKILTADDHHPPTLTHSPRRVQATHDDHKTLSEGVKLRRRLSRTGMVSMTTSLNESKTWKSTQLKKIKKYIHDLKAKLQKHEIRGDEMVKKTKQQIKSHMTELKCHDMKDSKLYENFRLFLIYLDDLDLPVKSRPQCEPRRDSDSQISRRPVLQHHEDHVDEAKGDGGPRRVSTDDAVAKKETMFALCCRRHDTLHPQV